MTSQTADSLSEPNQQIDDLRTAIRANQVSFPVPVPVFSNQYRSDIQWRLVELYFVHGWSPGRLAQRYHVSATRIRQSLRSWVRRARTLGYLQTVPAEDVLWAARSLPQAPAMDFMVPPPYVSTAFVGTQERV